MQGEGQQGGGGTGPFLDSPWQHSYVNAAVWFRFTSLIAHIVIKE